MNPFYQSTIAYLGAMVCEYFGVSLIIIMYRVYQTEREEQKYNLNGIQWDFHLVMGIIGIIGAALIVGGFDLVRRFVV